MRNRLFSTTSLAAQALALALLFGGQAFAARLRTFRLDGVPSPIAAQARKTFPDAFSEGASLAQIDEIVRFLMATGSFSYVEALEKDSQTIIQAVPLRKVSLIHVVGNQRFSTADILRRLGTSEGESFERKNVQSAADLITKDYGEAGYINAKAEISFATPNEKDVEITVAVDEGKPCKVAAVSFDVANPDLKLQLQRMAKKLVGDPLSNEAVYGFATKANDWFQSNRYLTARMSSPSVTLNEARDEAKLAWQVDSPYKWDLIFEGNVYFGDGELVAAMDLAKISGNSGSPAIDLAERVRKKYLDAGFAHATVDYSERSFDAIFKRQVRFKIFEGLKTRIRKIEITGSVSRPESYYSDFIRANSTDLISSNFYDRDDIAVGVKNLIVELQNQGFLRAKSQSTRVEFSKDGEYASVQIQIDEGALTQLRQIQFEGVSAFPKSTLADVLTVKSNSPLSLHALEESLQLLKNFYRSKGYLEMKVLNENDPASLIKYNDSDTQATVELNVQEGPKVIVASIVTRGNSFTKDFVILRELAFKVGDTLTPERIDESTVRLQRMALFSKVNIHTLEEGQNVSERTVLVEVDERDPGQFTTGAGITNEHILTYRGFGGFAYRNLYGTGRTISGRLDLQYSNDPNISFLENKATLSYVEPYMLGGRNRGRINLIRKQEFWQENPVTYEVQIRDSNIVELLLERDLTRHLRLTYTVWRFSNDTIFFRDTGVIAVTQNIGKVGPLLEYDLRNDTFNPTRGSYSFGSFEYADPLFGSSNDHSLTIQFLKLNAGFTHYVPLAKSQRYVWANAIRSGYLANLSNSQNSGVPAIEDFFLGGRSTIRGYDPTDTNQIIPNYNQVGILPSSINGLDTFYVTSDSYYYMLKSEFRFPIYGAVGGALFYDAGGVVISQPIFPTPIDNSVYRHAVGVALRIATPVGPINLEAGFKLNRRTTCVNPPLCSQTGLEEPTAYHFSIGTF